MSVSSLRIRHRCVPGPTALKKACAWATIRGDEVCRHQVRSSVDWGPYMTAPGQRVEQKKKRPGRSEREKRKLMASRKEGFGATGRSPS